MGKKQEHKDKYGKTKVLFKKCNNSIYTQSKTCFGTSQMSTTCGVLQMKKNLSQTADNNLKRDLSIETDFCVLRRYFKNKRARMSNQEGSAKSKYSTIVDPEINTIEELSPDISASGDNKLGNKILTADVATIMLENLKTLLNEWIQKHLLDNKDTKAKLETVLDLILHRLKMSKSQRVSSATTYILNNKHSKCEIRHNKIETHSDICQYSRRKPRPNLSKYVIYGHILNNSVPFLVRKLKIISTLSIPRNRNISWNKMKKLKHKNLVLSENKSSKLLNCSNFNILAISTSSVASRSSILNLKDHKKQITDLYPKLFIRNISNSNKTIDKTKSLTFNDEYINRDNLGEMVSLVKGIYADTPVININSEYDIDKPTETDKDTLTGNQITIINEQKNQNVQITTDFLDKSFEYSMNHNKDRCEHNVKSEMNKNINKIKQNTKRNKMSNVYKSQKIKNKNVTYHYKKSVNNVSQSRDVLKNLQNILQYFVDYIDNKNIKLDIQMTILPMIEPSDTEKKDEYTEMSNEKINLNKNTYNCEMVIDNRLNTNKSKYEQSKIENTSNISLYCHQNIIPLLDSAVSQARYFHTEHINKESEDQKIVTDQISKKSKYKIIDEIHELKSIIKELSETNDKIIKDHFTKEFNNTESKNIDYDTVKNIENNRYQLQNMSKGIQISNDFDKNILLSGIKLSKGPKKGASEFYNRLMKRSTSYKIIDSESILKVTDMSVVNEVNFNKVVDEGLTCSLPKSRSLFEVISESNKKKVLAYFCDDYCNKYSSSSCKQCINHNKYSLTHISSTERAECLKSTPSESNPNFPDCTSTIYVINDNENKCYDSKLISSKPRKIGFGKGLIYCVLFWIPVLIIVYLLYSYIIKDIIYPKASKPVRLKMGSVQETDARNCINKSTTFNLKLSDLGF